jgi:hypothetical protein
MESFQIYCKSRQDPKEERIFIGTLSTEEYIGGYFCKSYAANNKSPDPSWVSGFDTKTQQYPADVNDFAGVLISGSLSGVYDDDPWISRLLQEIKALDQKKVKTCGISFGHQAIAQALGGTVQKNPKVGIICPTPNKSSFFFLPCFEIVCGLLVNCPGCTVFTDPLTS